MNGVNNAAGSDSVTTPLSTKFMNHARTKTYPEAHGEASTDHTDLDNQGSEPLMTTPEMVKLPKAKRQRPSSSHKSPSLGDIGRDIGQIKDLLLSQATDLVAHKKQTAADVGIVHTRCDKLTAQFTTLEDDVAERFERESRKSDIVLRGIPLNAQTTRDQQVEIVRKLADHISVDISRRDILFTNKVQVGPAVGMLIVRFRDEVVRREFMQAFFAKGVVNINAIGFATDGRISIGDNLTRRGSQIRKRAIELKAAGQISFHGVRNGLVYIVLNGEQDRRTIKSLCELDGLVALKKPNPFSRLMGPSGSQVKTKMLEGPLKALSLKNRKNTI